MKVFALKLSVSSMKMTQLIHDKEQFSASKPSRECEIFVYKIPRSVCEQELRSMFEKYGDVFHLSLIQRPEKGYNYAFVRFSNTTAVKAAVLRWNGYEIRKRERISVCRSIENSKLVLFNVPRHMPSYAIKKFISFHTTGLQDVLAPKPRDGKSVNSGLAFLIYDTHTCASIAKRTLNNNKDIYGNKKRMYAEWHTPGLLWDDDPKFFSGNESEIPFGYCPVRHTAAEFSLWSTYGYYNLYKYHSQCLAARKISGFYCGYIDGY